MVSVMVPRFRDPIQSPTEHELGGPNEGCYPNCQSPPNGIRAKLSYILFSRMKFRVKCSFSTAVLTTRWPKPISICSFSTAVLTTRWPKPVSTFSLSGYRGYSWIQLSWPDAFRLQVLIWVLHVSETCWSTVWVGVMGRASKYTKFLLD